MSALRLAPTSKSACTLAKVPCRSSSSANAPVQCGKKATQVIPSKTSQKAKKSTRPSDHPRALFHSNGDPAPASKKKLQGGIRAEDDENKENIRPEGCLYPVLYPSTLVLCKEVARGRTVLQDLQFVIL